MRMDLVQEALGLRGVVVLTLAACRLVKEPPGVVIAARDGVDNFY